MIQKCSILKVLNVFFLEPTKIHFIREISREIKLAPTSVRNYLKVLEKDGLIKKEKGKPFDGFIANREHDKFQYYKRTFNLMELYDLINMIINSIHPRGIILFGSYLKGEDIEESDVDILIISKIRKNIDLKKEEEKLKRKIHLTFVNKIDDLEINLINNIKKGLILYGDLE